MQRTKRLIAGILCMVMLLSSVSIEAFASGSTEEQQSIENLIESAIQNDLSAETAVDETESAEASENETVVPENEPESTEAAEDAEPETEPVEATVNDSGASKWIYSVNADGYAVIEGYTDYAAAELSVPYVIDGYYVVAIGEGAFVNNAALSKLYIHGNVQSIAENAFDGLDVILSGYNGTTVMSYAAEKGLDFRLKSDQDYFTFKEQVIDFSYAEAGRYSYIDATTIQMAMPEALQLSAGDIFFLPVAYEELLAVYEVLSIEQIGDYARISVQNAKYQDVLTALSIKDEQMYADWSQAEWEDGVKILEEKWSSTAEGFISIGYEKELGEKKVSLPGIGGKKIKGKAGAKFFIEGSLNLKATANVDIDIGWFSTEVKELSLILEPSATVKTGIKFDMFDNKDENTETLWKMDEPHDCTVYIGSVPLISASGIVTVKAAIYAKVSATGEITLTFGGSGELGFKWNNSKGKFEGVNKWKWNTPTIDGSVKLEVGPCFAVELRAAVLGKVISLELFAGGVLEAKATVNFGGGGSADVGTGQSSLDQMRVCADLDIDGKISLTLKLELELLKDIIKTGGSWELFSAKKDIWNKHWEWRSGFVGFLDECTFESMNTVEFCTFTDEKIDSLEVLYNATFPEPKLKELANNKFLGWYTDPNFTKQWDFKKDRVTSDIKLYAKWEKSVKTVAFVTQNEEVDVADWTAQYIPGSNISEPSVKIMKWRLNGWYLDEELTDQWDFTKDIMPDKDITLYGSWTYDESYDPFASGSDKNYTISNGKLYYNGHVYQHIATYELFSAARAHAESQGGYLVTISSQEEMEAVLDYVQDDCAQQTLWLGINSTTDWKYWLNGEKMTYWNGLDPVTSSSQYNGIFYRADGTWDTYDNGSTSHYIIEWGDYQVDPGFAEYASSSTDGSAHYSPSEGGGSVSVVGFAKGENITISNIYDGLLVTQIDAYAFQNNTALKSITIPSTVETIGMYAFAGCTSLEEIVIPASVTSIGEGAFKGCTSLKKVVLPEGITVLPESIFEGCTSLEEIVNMEELVTILRYAFRDCVSLKEFVAPSKLYTIEGEAFYGCVSLEKLVLNSELMSIGYSAFQNCEKLSGTITIPHTCISVREEAFGNCKALEHVFLLCDGSALSYYAFEGVTALFHGKTENGIDVWCKDREKEFVSVDGTYRIRFDTTVAPSVSNSSDAEEEVTLQDIYLTAGSFVTEPTVAMKGYIVEGWYVDLGFTTKWDFARDKVGYADITLYANWVEEDEVFTYYVQAGNAYISEYGGKDENVIIPETLGGCTVVGIAADAFVGVDAMKSVAIPASVSVIEANAFVDCSNLYNITFPNGNDHFAFVNGVLFSADMTKLIYAAEARTFTEYIVPDSVTHVYSGAFKNHSDLMRVEIPETVLAIGENGFPVNPFIALYGPDEVCAAKKYAEDNALSYNEYSVTFYDGDKVLFSAVIRSGELLVEYAGFELEYATYAGWYRDRECTEPWNFDVDTMPAGNLCLYLKWDSDFAVEEGTNGLIITQYVGTNGVVVIPEEIGGSAVTEIAENAFVSTADAPLISITIPDCVTVIAEQAICGDPAPVIIANADSDAAVYAEAAGLVFEQRAYTITFETNGGVALAPMSLIPGEVPVLPTPVKSNCHFVGWYTNNFFNVLWTEENAMPAADITLCARWQVINNQVSSDFLFEITEEGNAVVTGYHGTKTVLALPKSINGYPVVAIGNFAFAENKTVETVIIPDSVQSLGEFAFANSAIRTVTGGGNIVSMGEGCFSGASALQTLFIPEGVTVIPDYCFEYCNAFIDVTIPAHVTQIGSYAFYGCDYLNSVMIPETVTQIGTGAFDGCRNLATVNVPSTLAGADETVFGTAQVSYYATGILNILSVKQLTKDSVQIIWNEVENADGYKLYRKQGTSGKYALIKTVTDTNTVNYSLKSGATYYYKVVAYQNTESGTANLAESGEHMIRIARLSTPTVSGVQITSGDTAQMKWSSVTGAEGYEIWRAYEANGEYSILKTVTETQTVNSGLVGGRAYFYKVRAFYNDDGTTEYSAFSDAYLFTMPLHFVDVPEKVTVRQTALGTALIEWTGVENADGYNIYRKRGDGSLAFVKTSLTTSTYNYSLVEGETYGYAVEAYCNTGKGTVTGGRSKVVSVTIASLATPYVKSVNQSAVQTALVSWTNVSAADGYELWRSRTENGKYSLMKAVTGTATSNYNLSVGGTYYYKVRAYVIAENGEYVYSAYSNAVPITILSVAKTRIKSVVQADATSAKVTWAYMSGAKSYEVWRSVNDNEHFELIRTTSGTAIQDRNLIDGQTYYYKIRAYDDSGEVPIYGEFSDELYLSIIGAPVIATLEQQGTNSVFITWDKVKNADGYEIYRSTDGTNYSILKSVAAASTSNYDLNVGSAYYYKIRAYKEVDGTKVYGNFSKTMGVRILGAPNVTSLLQNGSDGVKLTWSADKNASGYELWRSVAEDNGVFTKVKNVTGTSTTSFGLNETVATYKLRSYATVNGRKVYGPFGEPMSITILATPTFKEAVQASTSAVSLVWNEVEGATSYKVYRSSSPDTGFTLIKTVTGTETKNYSLKSGNTYYFKLKAVMNENGTSHEGAYSEAIAVYISDMVAPSIKDCTQTSEAITVTAAISGKADGIELWRAKESGDYIHISDSDTGIAIDHWYYDGEVYEYKVRAYVEVDGVRVYSAFSTPVKHSVLRVPVITTAMQIESDTVYLEWTSVTKATGYEISRSADNGESYTTVGIFEGNIATDVLDAEGTYLYRVRAVIEEAGNTSYSAWSSEEELVVKVYTGDDYPETQHPYSNYQNEIYTYTKEGAEALELTFSASSYTEYNYDFIYVLDGNGQCVARLSGTIGGQKLVVAGDTFKLYFTADSGGTGYGFSFDSIVEASLADAAEPIYPWYISGSKICVDGNCSDLSILGSREVFSHLTEVEVMDGTTALPDYAFSGMSYITKVTLPEGLLTIGKRAFNECTGLVQIVIPETVTLIDHYAFYACRNLKEIHIPASVTEIGEYAFGYCTSITEVVIPETVEHISYYAFTNCVALTDVTMSTTTRNGYYYYSGSNATAYGIFAGCTNLKNVTFSNNPTSINAGLFAGSGIQKITIPATVTEIGAYAFANCSQLTEVIYAGNQVTNIREYAFARAEALTTAPICDGVTEIGEYAFARCEGITNVVIPASVNNVNSRTFEGCVNLTDLVINSNFEYTYTYNSSSAQAWGIFNECDNLTNVTFGYAITRIGNGMFAGSGIKSITIPATVTEIGDYAFANCEKLEKVTYAGNAVTKIGAYAFANAKSLTEAPICDGITTIGDYAFARCSSMRSVVLPESVEDLNSRTFENCTGLTDVVLNKDYSYTYTYNSSSAQAWGIFNGCTNLTNVSFGEGVTRIGQGLLAGSGIQRVVIPASVTEIGEYAFANCGRLEEVVYEGNAVTTIGEYAFANAVALRYAPIPEGITQIKAYTYYGCKNITNLALNDCITQIDAYAFANCDGLKEIRLPATLKSIASRAFSNCDGLTDLYIPATFGEMSMGYSSGRGVFDGCTALKNIVFAEGVTKIPEGAFAGSSIREIAIPATVTEIGAYAFSYCEKLRNIDLPEGLTTIGNNAFQYCRILKRFTLPSTLTALGSYAFRSCADLTSVTIPEGITVVSSNLFQDCIGLTTVKMSGAVTAIQDNAFSGCSKLKKLVIPGTVTSISNNALKGLTVQTAGPIGGGYDYEFGWTDTIPTNAFRGLKSLTSVVIPEGVTAIATNAFTDSSVVSVSLPGSVTSVGTYCFNNCDSLTEISWPAGAATIPERCFNDCDALTGVVIPEGVTSINSRAFYGCGALKSVIMPSTVTTIHADAFNGIAATSAGPAGGEYDYQFAWTETIPANAFYRMGKLASVVIPDGITTIGGSAFYECGLQSVVLPDHVTSVGAYCFYNCDSLTNVTWSANAVTIPERCFNDCDALESITIPEGVITISSRAFYSCGALKNIAMPSTVTTIHTDAFNGIAAVTAGPMDGDYDYRFAWTENIPANAFYRIGSLALITIPDGITTIGGSAFYESGLNLLMLPDSVTSVGSHCFNNCDSLTNVTWSANAVTIPERCFYDCDSLSSITIPEGVATVGARAFYGSGVLKHITMPSTVTSIHTDAFYGIAATSAGPVGSVCDYQFAWTETIPANAFYKIGSLAQVTIPDGITTIMGSAFYETGLTSIILPDSVTSVGIYCFNNCDSLTEVTWSANAASIPERCFYDCDGLVSIVIPEGVTSVGNRAFYSSGNLAAVTIPDSVTTINSGAFTNCSKAIILYCADDSYAATYAEANGFAHQKP